MAASKSSYDYEELLACARGELFGPGQRPAALSADADVQPHHRDQRDRRRIRQGLHPRRTRHPAATSGSSPATSSAIRSCRAASASTRMWQLTGFFLGWLGEPGKGRALSTGEVKFTGMVTPATKKVEYGVDFKRVMRGRLVLGIGDGWLKADGETIYKATDLRVGLFKQTRGLSGRRIDDKEFAHETGRRHGPWHRFVHRQQCRRGHAPRCTTPNPASASPSPSPSTASAARSGARRRSIPRRLIDRRAHALPAQGRRVEPRRHGAGDRRCRPRGGRHHQRAHRHHHGLRRPVDAHHRRGRRHHPQEQQPQAHRPVRRAEGDVVDGLGDACHLVQDPRRQLFDLVGLLDLGALHRQRLRD